MQLSSILALAPFVAAVLGLTIPEGTPDGLYIVTKDGDGNDVHERVTNVTAPDSQAFRRATRAPRGFGPLSKRDSSGSTQHTLPNHDDYNYCTDYWWSYTYNGNDVPPRSIVYCTRGITVLAGCNYRNVISDIYPHTVNQFNAHMDSTYGFWRTGWLYSDEYQFTFWRDIHGTPFCTNLP
ncbi:hypothetical protein V8F20_005204 [Naviculisporaceae sp. PSN 640]